MKHKKSLPFDPFELVPDTTHILSDQAYNKYQQNKGFWHGVRLTAYTAIALALLAFVLYSQLAPKHDYTMTPSMYQNYLDTCAKAQVTAKASDTTPTPLPHVKPKPTAKQPTSPVVAFTAPPKLIAPQATAPLTKEQIAQQAQNAFFKPLCKATNDFIVTLVAYPDSIKTMPTSDPWRCVFDGTQRLRELRRYPFYPVADHGPIDKFIIWIYSQSNGQI